MDLRKKFKEIGKRCLEHMKEVAGQQIDNREKRKKVAQALNHEFDIPMLPEWVENLFFLGIIEVVYVAGFKNDGGS